MIITSCFCSEEGVERNIGEIEGLEVWVDSGGTRVPSGPCTEGDCAALEIESSLVAY